jgi:hypothetical protein
VSVSQTIKERFLAGETLNQSDMAKEYGCSSSLGALVRKQMTGEGFVFESSNRVVDGKRLTDWTLTGGQAEPREEEVMAEIHTENAKAKTNGQSPLPVLGQTVTVSLLSMSDSGVVSLGFRDGKRVWLCQLVGETK